MIFYYIAFSEDSPVTDINTLKYSYTLPEIFKLKEMIDIRSASKEAAHKDQEVRQKIEQTRNSRG